MKKDDKHPQAERLFTAITQLADEEAACRIAYGVPLAASASDQGKAAWVRYVVRELERTFAADTVGRILERCHCDVEGRLPEMKEWLGGLYRESESVGDFVDRVNACGAGWYMRDGAIYAKFLNCECHMLQGLERLETPTWCRCALGYTRELFRHVFGREVDSELLRCIRTGGEYCLIRITPK